MKIREIRCAYCGSYINEMHVTDPADGLHTEYDKNRKENPKYCCYQCSIITELNRAYGDMINGKKTPLETAKFIREKAEYIENNGDAITDHYIRKWQEQRERQQRETEEDNK